MDLVLFFRALVFIFFRFGVCKRLIGNDGPVQSVIADCRYTVCIKQVQRNAGPYRSGRLGAAQRQATYYIDSGQLVVRLHQNIVGCIQCRLIIYQDQAVAVAVLQV